MAPATVDLSARLGATPPTGPNPDPANGTPFDGDTEEIISGYTRLRAECGPGSPRD
ncbi:hypothetical protein [Streptomyces sp. H27-C3]|uniref:hypothetical protein n=1 Tax=Streptomyces sp. H27-C3 TaxID=3046305 RepID=UPI0024BAC0F1|nr:hypothetical protein [Streptomyces sp. H27-C3]MDJ0463493.1 hypothetical protein [Streptomyces sp. H27-C3]